MNFINYGKNNEISADGFCFANENCLVNWCGTYLPCHEDTCFLDIF